jgi:copper chaperone NosL
MRFFLIVASLLSALLTAGCENEARTTPPPPFALTADAMGRYCGMNVLEHAGPKGQVILDAKVGEPIWFSSARDTLAFTMLPEEPKDYVAIYVSDMGKAPSWEQPGATNWIDAKTAFYVIGSKLKGGMGADEAVPFSSKAAAAQFAATNGGKVVNFADVPRDYVLGGGDDAAGADTTPEAAVNHDSKGDDHG